MNARLGWGLFAVGAAAAGAVYGWRGLVMAASAAVFWLLLQYGRVLRVLRRAGQAPVGAVDSAVMLQARLQPGMRLLQVVTLTGSIGRPVQDKSDAYRWTDAGGDSVDAVFAGGKLQRWDIVRGTASDT